MHDYKMVVFFFLLMVPLIAFAEPEVGVASYYADSLQGNLTSSEEPYDKDALTAAHRTLPFGTRIVVSNLDNGKSAVVIINDRGPYSQDRLIDVSGAAARQLGLIESGIAKVKIEVLE